MAKPPKQKDAAEAFARRRAGGSYIGVAAAALRRLYQLSEDFDNVPESYKGYLLVGVVTCLESHLKYCYAHAAERFAEHPEVLQQLYKDISVEIESLISTSTRSFHLADVIAASIKASSLFSYNKQASHFFTVLDGKPHNFPWDLAKVFHTGGDDEGAKLFAAQLERLEKAFAFRHDFVHETVDGAFPAELRDAVDDARVLIILFEKHLENLEMSPRYAQVLPDEDMRDATDRCSEEIKERFEKIRQATELRQHAKLDELQTAFVDYYHARAEFEASVFLVDGSTAAMSYFIDLMPEQRAAVRDIGLKVQYLLARYPASQQYQDMGFPPEGPPNAE